MPPHTRIVPMRELAFRCLGIPYLLGAKAWDPTRIPDKLDCSGFIHLLVAGKVVVPGFDYPLGAGLTVIRKPDGTEAPVSSFHGSWIQGSMCRRIPVADALANVGCFLFKDPGTGKHGHVEMSLGANHTIGATGGLGGMVTVRRPSEQGAVRWSYGAKLDALWGTVA